MAHRKSHQQQHPLDRIFTVVFLVGVDSDASLGISEMSAVGTEGAGKAAKEDAMASEQPLGSKTGTGAPPACGEGTKVTEQPLAIAAEPLGRKTWTGAPPACGAGTKVISLP